MPNQTAESSTDSSEQMRQLIELIVRALVDHPQDAQVTKADGAHVTVFEICVHADDVDKVIGKKGIHADAMRRIVNAVSGKHKRRYTVEILE